MLNKRDLVKCKDITKYFATTRILLQENVNRYDTVFLIYFSVEKSKLQKANTMFFNIHVHRLKKTWKNMSKCSQCFIDAVVLTLFLSLLCVFFPKFSVINMLLL